MNSSSRPSRRGRTRRTFVFGLTIGIIAILGVVAVLIVRPPNTKPIESAKGPSCSTNIAHAGKADKSLQPLDVEELGDYGLIKISPAERAGDACTISIITSPPVDAATVDWRVGLSVDDAKQFSGKTVQFTFKLGADRDMTFPSSEFYIYDGTKVTSAGIPPIQQGQTTSATLTHKVSENSETLQFWLRLVSPNTPGNRVLNPGNIYLQGIEMVQSGQ